MKAKFTFALMAVAHIGFCQGFVNLDFESAKIIPIVGDPNYPYAIAVTNALPGWTASLGSLQLTQMTYNAPALGSTWITLYATNGNQISGNYSVLLQGGLTRSDATISQTGLVPASSASLLFEAQQTGAGTLLVSLGGQNLTFFALASGSNYTLYGADISVFAGQTTVLSFSALEVSTYNNIWNLDNIQFSASPVPEPGVLGLFALGGAFLAFRRWK